MRVGFWRMAGIALTLGAALASAGNAETPEATAAEFPPADTVAAIGRINPGTGAYCTGTLVARNIVVTAAHCLFDLRTKRWVRAESLHFLPGYRSGHYDHHARVSRYAVSPSFDADAPTRDPSADWAVLVLTGDVPAASSPLPTGTIGASETISEVKGYAIQRKYALSTSGPCRTRLVGGTLLGQCKAEKGMSGAPLIDVSTGRMIGMQVAGGRQNGRDVLVAVPTSGWQAVLDDLMTDEAGRRGTYQLQ